ncbi:MAG: aldehyde dehydrogenase family protein, partial [Pusillimonas sp.]|nr:aldehyde dehydrogenase family protein [Pusillimonas sp.]
MLEIKNFINGQWVSTSKTFEDVNPVNGQVIAKVHEAGRDEVDAAVKAARAALRGPWSQMKVDERGAMLVAIADEINRRFDAFLEAEIADTGKPHSLASHLDIPRGAANFKAFADLMRSSPTECFPMRTPDNGHAINYGV